MSLHYAFTFLGAVVLLATACSQSPAVGGTQVPGPSREVSTEDAVTAEIADAWQQHVEAGKRGDGRAAMATFDDEGTYVEPWGVSVSGRKALDSSEVANFRAFKLVDARHRMIAVRVIGAHVYEVGESSGSTQVPGHPPTSFGPVSYMASWRRAADRKLRVHFMVAYP